ncbi:RIP metalloprotease RseP [Thioalkalivibrio sp. XN8]|uniref:RIP metalloprotease RseP n=1 Tax=Thioalkalivibrio sp. XN8 TaxID=2712863 RepID=UPI0013EC850A|nr:RIP metalloprotease RseP [Thioalkalivibrio sp. XN8]NGP53620.1 RIP metalloprotease RseP [Thioalkalivibrio sp. XN8]
MNELLTSVLAFVVAISVLVAVHEYGHFWVARRLGIKVLRFSVGFGSPLWRRTGRDGTEYWISAIPLGGYVKMLDEREGNVPPEDLPRCFNRQSPQRRIAVLFAGPAFNFIFAIAAYWVIFVAGVPAIKPMVGEIAAASPAAEAGLQAGDQIVAIDGAPTRTMMEAQLELLSAMVPAGRARLLVEDAAGARRELALRYDGDIQALTEPNAMFPELGISFWRPSVPAVVGELLPEGTAAAAGLQPGDRVLSAAGEPIAEWQDWVEFVRARPGETVGLLIERDGNPMRLELLIGAADEEGVRVGRIGAGPQILAELWDPIRTEQRYGPVAAVGRAVGETWRISELTVTMMARMIMGQVSVKNLSGPINIAQTAGFTAAAGFAAFVTFLAIVSISLGIINLLPIPMLDGGQIVYQVVELAKGSPVSERAQIIGQQVGIFLLLLLMSFAFYNDIVRITAG